MQGVLRGVVWAAGLRGWGGRRLLAKSVRGYVSSGAFKLFEDFILLVLVVQTFQGSDDLSGDVSIIVYLLCR